MYYIHESWKQYNFGVQRGLVRSEVSSLLMSDQGKTPIINPKLTIAVFATEKFIITLLSAFQDHWSTPSQLQNISRTPT
jgi:hypothetical protein